MMRHSEEALAFVREDREDDHAVEHANRSSPTSKANLTFINGLALVISLQIGSGIFSAPSVTANHVPSPGIGILVWLCGGLLVWTGA